MAESSSSHMTLEDLNPTPRWKVGHIRLNKSIIVELHKHAPIVSWAHTDLRASLFKLETPVKMNPGTSWRTNLQFNFLNSANQLSFQMCQLEIEQLHKTGQQERRNRQSEHILLNGPMQSKNEPLAVSAFSWTSVTLALESMDAEANALIQNHNLNTDPKT